MGNELQPAPDANAARWCTGKTGRFALLVAFLAVAAGTFVYLGGWLTPGRLTQGQFADVFQAVDGLHPGFRRNHAKGLCVAGYFESSGNGVAISKAAVFESGRTPVVGRFSLAGECRFNRIRRGRSAGWGWNSTRMERSGGRR